MLIMEGIMMWSSLLRSRVRSLRDSAASRTIALALLGTSALGGVALAVTSDVFQYSAAQTGYYNLSPMAFAPQSNAVADGFLNDQQGCRLQLAAPMPPPCLLFDGAQSAASGHAEETRRVVRQRYRQ